MKTMTTGLVACLIGSAAQAQMTCEGLTAESLGAI